MLIASKDGTVQVFTSSGGLIFAPVIDLRSQVNTATDRGLLGIAVDSDYVHNHFVYLLYTHQSNPADVNGPQTSQLLRVVLNDDNSVGAETPILGSVSTDPCPAPSNTSDCIPSDGLSHSIGTVRADPDGTLWVGSGDAADYNTVDPLALRTYDETSFAGKIIHIDRNGRGLAGHPFCPSDSNLSHVCTKLYAKGFRNPFRFTLRSGGAGPAVGDVGWYSWEELDLTRPGGDYGWPCWEGNGHTPGYESLAGCSGSGGEYSRSAQLPDFTFSHADGGVAIVGGPTYDGSDFPSAYAGTTFFGDYGSGILRSWNPATSTATTFATGAGGWVDLESAPAGLSYAHRGDLLYVNIGNFGDGLGTVGRVFYPGGNRLPVASASATPTVGDVPLDVSFRGDASSDPDGDPLTYDWDFGDGSPHSTQANPSHRYAARGRYTAQLTVSDGHGGTGSDTVVVTAGGPVATIAAPTDRSLFRDGIAVPLQGSATDAAGQSVPDSGLSWHVILHHSSSHTHDLGNFSGGSTSFTPWINHDADSWYDVTLKATDANGLSDSRTVSVYPESVRFTLASSPTGAPVTYAGLAGPAPFNMTSAIGFLTSISAADQFTAPNGSTYAFESWSDGGARLHDITIPATDTTLTARYDGVPTAHVSPATASGTAPLTVNFSATDSSDPDGDPLTYDWDFGDGSPHSSLASPSHSYGAGDYSARVTVQDGRGQSASATAGVHVDPGTAVGGGSGGDTVPGAIAGSGPSVGPTLVDRLGPVVRIGASAAGLRRGRLSGTARDRSRIRQVEVAVRTWHVGGTPCRWWSPSRRALTKPRACSAPIWIRARVTGLSWSVSLGRALPRGFYVVRVRAIDRRGNATTRITTAALR